MGLMSKSTGEGKSFEPVPEGLHPAVCWVVCDLGIQRKGGQFPGESRQVYLGFEISDKFIEFEKDGTTQRGPMRIGMTITNSLNERANLRKYLEKWRGRPFTEVELKGFDLGKLVGLSCQLVVTHTTKGDKTYANIDNILRAAPGLVPHTPERTVMFSLADHDIRDFEDVLPKWLVEKVQARVADNWEEFNAPAEPRSSPPADHEDTPEFEDDIPF